MRPLTRLLTGLSAAALLGSAALPALAVTPPVAVAEAPAAAADAQLLQRSEAIIATRPNLPCTDSCTASPS